MTVFCVLADELPLQQSAQQDSETDNRLIYSDGGTRQRISSNQGLLAEQESAFSHDSVTFLSRVADSRSSVSFGADCSSGVRAETSYNGFVTVDPLGDDANDGTLNRPVRSVGRAIALVSRGDRRTVRLRKGIYRIAEPLVLTAAMDGVSILGCGGEPVVLDGQAASPAMVLSGVRDVIVGGLTFMGVYPVQVMLEGASNCLIADNAILRSQTAILLDHANGNRILRNLARSPGLTGIELRDGSDANVIADNVVVGAAGLETQGGGIFLHGVRDNRIAHNLVASTAGFGIGVGNWDEATINIGNVIEYNVLRDTALDSTDSGAIYLLGRSGVDTRAVIAGNVVDGVGDPHAVGRHNVGIYLDDSTSGAVVTRNIVRRVASDAVQIHGGSGNLVENNLLDLGPQRPSAVLFQAAPDDTNPLNLQTGNVVTRNVILSSAADPKLFVWLDGGSPSIVGNLYSNATGAAPGFAPQVSDLAPVIADPALAADGGQDGYSIAQKAAATAIGFRLIEPTFAGPRPRRSQP